VTLAARVAAALPRLDPAAAGADPQVRRSQHADFQVNAAFGLAKALGRRPAELAAELAEVLEVDDVCAEVEVAPQGFLNLRLAPSFVSGELLGLLDDERLGVRPDDRPGTVVVDYSAPNVAKEMHVGHLRSTVIGDALARLAQGLGRTVVRQNHLGDWGTPFGMLIEHLVDLGEEEAARELSVGDLNGFYKAARQKFDADEAFAERARQRVVALQGGDAESLARWERLVAESKRYFSHIYDLLDVTLTEGDYAGESSYNDRLDAVVDELAAKGLLVTDAGADCVFPEGFVGREGEPQPVIVRKSDGGYGYAATDLAALRHRLVELDATLCLYVVGAPQNTHLEMVFEVARMAGWLAPPADAVHVSFGSILGADGKMFRTRSGESIKLADLLAEAERRALEVVAAKSPQLSDEEQAEVAHAVGIGAVKYADLSVDRVKDYRFDWDRMLALQGNTAPYLQYANARIRSILRKADDQGVDRTPPAALVLDEPVEWQLALALLSFDGAVHEAMGAYAPHKLCTHLFDLASTFTTFYETCPVLTSEGDVRATRLVLCELTSRVLVRGLALLGIETPDRI
jgi:arginyl-tRNA synthetase